MNPVDRGIAWGHNRVQPRSQATSSALGKNSGDERFRRPGASPPSDHPRARRVPPGRRRRALGARRTCDAAVTQTPACEHGRRLARQFGRSQVLSRGLRGPSRRSTWCLQNRTAVFGLALRATCCSPSSGSGTGIHVVTFVPRSPFFTTYPRESHRRNVKCLCTRGTRESDTLPLPPRRCARRNDRSDEPLRGSTAGCACSCSTSWSSWALDPD